MDTGRIASNRPSYRTVIRPPRDDPKTPENEADRAYYGAFVGDLNEDVDGDGKAGTVEDVKLQIKSNEDKTGEKLDYVLKFWSVIHAKSFPSDAAEGAYQKGAALLIKDQPGGIPSNWRDNSPQAVQLSAIIQQIKYKSGDYYDAYVKFARECMAWGVGTGENGADKPIFLSLGHEMNGNWYSWAGDPAAYKEYFQLVHDLLIENGATNITFLFNPNIYGVTDSLDYFPGEKHVDYIGLNGYQKKAWSNWKSAADLFANDIRKFADNSETKDIPLMIAEYGRDRDDIVGEETIATIEGTLKYVTQPGNTDGVTALTYFDKDTDYKWELKDANFTDFKKGIDAQKWYFTGGIETEKVYFNADKNDVIIMYPNPYRPGSGGNFDAPYITFKNLTENTRIRIFNIAGELVKEDIANSYGNYEWNACNNSGEKVASGVYIVLATNDQGMKKTGKIAIIK